MSAFASSTALHDEDNIADALPMNGIATISDIKAGINKKAMEFFHTHLSCCVTIWNHVLFYMLLQGIIAKRAECPNN
jgi:hypothetical protein